MQTYLLSTTIIGMRSFGLSAPGKVAEAHFGFDVAHVVAAAKSQVALRLRTSRVSNGFASRDETAANNSGEPYV